MNITHEELVARELASRVPYPVACICGSMQFHDWMLKVAERYTLNGHIVLMPFVRKDSALSLSERNFRHESEQKLPDGVNLPIFLDSMHRAKIDMSDLVVVCTNAEHYIGSSTRDEILYATKRGKTVVVEAAS